MQHPGQQVGLVFPQAASFPETFFTVWTNVFDRGRLQAGQTFLVHGGSSGIGVTAIQLAKAFGASVYTTVGNAEKVEAVKKIGADAAINYKEQDWTEEIDRLTGGKGVNLILDMVGGDYIQKNLQSLAPEGRLVQIAFQKGAIARALLVKVWPLLEAKKVRPVIHTTFPLAEAQKAHELMESSVHIGKIVLRVKGDYGEFGGNVGFSNASKTSATGLRISIPDFAIGNFVSC